MQEEIGVTVEVGRPLATFLVPIKVDVSRFFVIYECTLTSSVDAIAPDMTEVGEVKWVDATEMEILLMPDNWRLVLKNYFQI